MEFISILLFLATLVGVLDLNKKRAITAARVKTARAVKIELVQYNTGQSAVSKDAEIIKSLCHLHQAVLSAREAAKNIDHAAPPPSKDDEVVPIKGVELICAASFKEDDNKWVSWTRTGSPLFFSAMERSVYHALQHKGDKIPSLDVLEDLENFEADNITYKQEKAPIILSADEAKRASEVAKQLPQTVKQYIADNPLKGLVRVNTSIKFNYKGADGKDLVGGLKDTEFFYGVYDSYPPREEEKKTPALGPIFENIDPLDWANIKYSELLDVYTEEVSLDTEIPRIIPLGKPEKFMFNNGIKPLLDNKIKNLNLDPANRAEVKKLMDLEAAVASASLGIKIPSIKKIRLLKKVHEDAAKLYCPEIMDLLINRSLDDHRENEYNITFGDRASSIEDIEIDKDDPTSVRGELDFIPLFKEETGVKIPGKIIKTRVTTLPAFMFGRLQKGWASIHAALGIWASIERPKEKLAAATGIEKLPGIVRENLKSRAGVNDLSKIPANIITTLASLGDEHAMLAKVVSLPKASFAEVVKAPAKSASKKEKIKEKKSPKVKKPKEDIKDSKESNKTIKCDGCNRKFVNARALQMHSEATGHKKDKSSQTGKGNKPKPDNKQVKKPENKDPIPEQYVLKGSNKVKNTIRGIFKTDDVREILRQISDAGIKREAGQKIDFFKVCKYIHATPKGPRLKTGVKAKDLTDIYK
jgi:hypothetical protein